MKTVSYNESLLFSWTPITSLACKKRSSFEKYPLTWEYCKFYSFFLNKKLTLRYMYMQNTTITIVQLFKL